MLPPSALCPAPPRANRQPVRGAPRARALSLRTRPGGEGRGSADESGRTRARESALFRRPRPRSPPPNVLRHPQRAQGQGLHSATLLSPSNAEGHPQGTDGRGAATFAWVSGCALRYLVPLALPFSIFSFLPEARYSARHRPLRLPSALLGPRRLRAQEVASSARGPPPPRHSPPRPLTPSPLPPPGLGAARGMGRGRGEGRGGEREHRVATPPEPAFSRAAAGGSPPAPRSPPGRAQLRHSLRSASATPLSELRRSQRESAPSAPPPRLPAPDPRGSVPGPPRAPRPRRLPSPGPAPHPAQLGLCLCPPPPTPTPFLSLSFACLLVC